MDFATLAGVIKKYAKNIKISDEEFINGLISPVVNTYDVPNRNGDPLYLTKSHISEIVNHKRDVPAALKRAVENPDAVDCIAEEMTKFIKTYIDESKFSNLRIELIKSAKADPDISMELSNELEENCYDVNTLMSRLLIVSLRTDNRYFKSKVTLSKNGKNKIDVITGDLFDFRFNNRKESRNIVVIPVNTAFDTHITRKIENDPYPLVSENTIHGQWLNRMEKSGENIESLNTRIFASLKSFDVTPVGKAVVGNGNKDTYPIGSIAVIEHKNSIFFLVAASEFDNHNNAKSTQEDIKLAINSIIRYYDIIGQGYDMYMPVIGTGRSRSGMSYREGYELLKQMLLENRSRIYGNISIVIYKDNVDEINM